MTDEAKAITAYDLFTILVELNADEGFEDADWRAVAIRRVRNRIRERMIEADPSWIGKHLMAIEPPRPREYSGPPFSPAPTWTREAPKEDGFYWTRVFRVHGQPVEIMRYEQPSRGSSWCWFHTQSDEGYPADLIEHWPVKLEPPT